MRCRILTVLVTLSAMRIAMAQSWVSFHSPAPQPPSIDLLESDDQHVKYRIIVPGMWVRSVAQRSITYQMLELDNNTKDEQLGLPSLPRVSTNIALPQGATLEVTVVEGRTLYFSRYRVAPVPEVTITYDNGIAQFTETYTEDPVIYGMSTYYPENLRSERERGVFVTQEVGGVNVYPIRFNPVEGKLAVTDTLTVTVEFQDGAGPATQNLGIFNEATRGVLINCSLPGEPFHQPSNGSVTWVDAVETSIDCDYLIIIPDSAWTNLPRNNGFVEKGKRDFQILGKVIGLMRKI